MIWTKKEYFGQLTTVYNITQNTAKRSKQRPVMCDSCKMTSKMTRDARRMEIEERKIVDSFAILIMISKVFRSRGIFQVNL